MIFHTKLAYLFDPQRGHRLVLHLRSAKRPEKHFDFPFGSGAFNHFYCELLKAGMSAIQWRDAIAAVMAGDGLFQPLPSLDLDNEVIARFMGEMRARQTLADVLN